MDILIYFGTFLAAVASIKLLHRAILDARVRFPPGPPAIPFIGHVRIMPQATDFPWKVFAKWGKKWGGIIYVHVFGMPMIIINDLEIARELMEKRGAVYSDRPPLLLISQMMGWDKVVAFKRYSDSDFRVQRKMMQQHFSAQAVKSFQGIQLRELNIFLENLLTSPDSFIQHIHRFTTATIMMVTYGYTIDSDNDQYTTLIDKAVTMTVESGPPGGTLVDLIPVLRHVPAWFPGAEFKRHALKTRELVHESMRKPFDFVKRSRTSGTALPSVISSLLDEAEENSVADFGYENNIQAVGGNIYAAGFETVLYAEGRDLMYCLTTTKTTAAILTFILAMVRHPEVAEQAQAEIDRIIGGERLPTLKDRDKLPFIDCILKETLRWNPPLPLGLPHRLMEDDDFNGMHIPQGSMIIPNIWQYTRDERYYPEPECFNPNRFLQKVTAGLSEEFCNPIKIVFGFGRRICPGEFMVEAGMWMTIACTLAAFDFKPPVGEDGLEYMPAMTFTSGATSHPETFQCRIVPRSEKYAQLIVQEIHE